MIADALFEDPCDIAHSSDAPEPRYSNAPKALYAILKAHDVDMTSIEVEEAEGWKVESMKDAAPEDAERILQSYGERDQIPHICAFLMLLTKSLKRSGYFESLFRCLTAAKQWKSENPGPRHQRWSAPTIHRSYLPQGTPHDFPEIFLRLAAECGVPASKANTFFMDMEYGTLPVRGDHINLPISFCLLDTHAHVLQSEGVQPSGVADMPKGARFEIDPVLSGVKPEDYKNFRDFREVYPFFWRLFDSSKVLVGHGPDGDVSGLGARLPATQVRDTGAFYPVALLAKAAAEKRGVKDPVRP